MDGNDGKDRMVTVQEAAESLGVTVWMVYSHIFMGHVKTQKGGTFVSLNGLKGCSDDDTSGEDHFIPAKEAAQKLGVTPQAIHGRIRRGTLKAQRRKMLVSLDDLERRREKYGKYDSKRWQSRD